MPETRITVRYPVGDGRIVLRTDLDWDADVEPIDADIDGGEFRFTVDTDRAYFYFKPCLAQGDEMVWPRNSDYLAIVDSAVEPVVYPYFFKEPTGEITDPVDVTSESVPDPHRIRLYLPPSYEENSLRRYPVLYMHDGHNLFFPEEAFTGDTWEVKETLELLDEMNITGEVIVVGVSPADRLREYTKPGYEDYGRFLAKELKPLIDRTYRTLPDPQHTAVMGSSLGGVVSLFCAWEYPEVFGKCACMSSTFAMEDDLRERIANEPKRKVRFYLDSGGRGDNFEVTKAMTELLQRRGYEYGRDLIYLAFPQSGHSESDWAVRAHIPFQYFFGTSVPTD